MMGRKRHTLSERCLLCQRARGFPWSLTVQRSYMFIFGAGPRAGSCYGTKARALAPDTQQMIGVQVALTARFFRVKLTAAGSEDELALSQFQSCRIGPGTGTVNEKHCSVERTCLNRLLMTRLRWRYVGVPLSHRCLET